MRREKTMESGLTVNIAKDESFVQLKEEMPYAEHAFGTKAGTGENLDATIRYYTEKLGPIAHMRQVHGNRISYVSTPGVYEECDAVYTDHADLWLAVKTADCVPVLISTPSAVAALHCGWRGLQSGLISKMVNLLEEEFNVTPTEMFVAIGPHISQEIYEVDNTFLEDFDEKFFRPSKTQGKVLMDLAGIAKQQAKDMGINDLNILDRDMCTFKNKETFHSYRRAKQQNEDGYAVQLSLIARHVDFD